jgi:hypothetical protein
MGAKLGPLSLRQQYRQKTFENRVPRKLLWPKRDKLTAEWRRLHDEELAICTPHQILVGRSNQDEFDGRDMLHVCGEESCMQGSGVETLWKETTWNT